MLQKKSKKADLERNKGLFIQISLVLVLSLVLIAFDWESKPTQENNSFFSKGQPFQIDEVMPIIRENTPPVNEKITDFITFVPDDTPIAVDIDFNVEATEKTEILFKGFTDEIEEIEETVDFLPVEDMPKFNGGDPAIEFRKFIIQNLNYPDIAAENGVKGRVIVQFVINSKGKLVDAVVLRSVDPALDKEALRVVLSSPSWTPGNQRGKPVRVVYTFPITFVLQ